MDPATTFQSIILMASWILSFGAMSMNAGKYTFKYELQIDFRRLGAVGSCMPPLLFQELLMG